MILFLSNGHGEDLNASLIIQALSDRDPALKVTALPLVGSGKAYRKLTVPIIGPTQTLPSGGIIYTHPWNWFKDLGAGLLGLTLRQLRAVFRHHRHCHGIVAVGDIVPIAIAYLTGRPFAAFIVSTSSYYEGRLKLPWLTAHCLRSQRCLSILTRDRFTALDLQKRGMDKAQFLGYPIMDVLTPSGQDLQLDPALPTIALLPGSRLPEALNNLALQLKVCEEIAQRQATNFRVALIADITEAELALLAQQQQWQYQSLGILSKTIGEQAIEVRCCWGAFADILHHCQLAIGMAGTAVEQAVGLGKPVVQIPGNGPQFTYPFAEAQMRLLGCSVQTVGKKATDSALFVQAAQLMISILQDQDYLEECRQNGLQRVGLPGGSTAIARYLAQIFNEPDRV